MPGPYRGAAYDMQAGTAAYSREYPTAHHAILLLISAKPPTFRPDATPEDYDYFVVDSQGVTVPALRIAQDN
jgi:hypothetical protein